MNFNPLAPNMLFRRASWMNGMQPTPLLSRTLESPSATRNARLTPNTFYVEVVLGSRIGPSTPTGHSSTGSPRSRLLGDITNESSVLRDTLAFQLGNDATKMTLHSSQRSTPATT